MKSLLAFALVMAALPGAAEAAAPRAEGPSLATPPSIATLPAPPASNARNGNAASASTDGAAASSGTTTTTTKTTPSGGVVITTTGRIGGSTTDVSTTTAPQRGEPEIRHIVVEDDGARIDELRVRSVPQRIVVTTKGVRGTTYEIITGDGSRDLSDGANTSRGAAGKRVWRVLDF